MEKEKKSLLEKFKGLSKKWKIGLITIIMIIIVIIVGVIIFNLNNNSNNDNNAQQSINENTITTEELKNYLKQLEMGNYIQDDSVKLGPIIDFNYNNYNKLVSYSCIYHNNNVTMNEGGLILVNEENKEYKNIAQPIETSAIIYDLNTKNQSDHLKEIMSLLSTYFIENGIDNFGSVRANSSDTLDKYAELGKDIGTIVGIKEGRTIVENKYMSNIKYKNEDTGDSSLLYERMNIFPMYLGATTTEMEYAWDSIGLPEDALGLLTSEEKTTMAMVNGPAYRNVKKYTIAEFNTATNNPKIVGKYSSKEDAKSALKLEEATDEPIIETEESKEVAGIEQMIGFLNSYYDLNFTPTDEQMQEIIEFSNSTDEFNNDTLMEFILQKGWTASGTGTVDNSSENSNSGTTSNSNNSSGNNKNTNKNSNDSNTSTYEEIKATLSINIKDLINNSTDPEVETILQSNTLQVSIFVEESEEKSEYLMYHGGIDSIPNTITQEFTFDITNKTSIKSNVKIVIDNTSTMIRESTLYDKAITFDKTGTYTIK
mgnify:FL=1